MSGGSALAPLFDRFRLGGCDISNRFVMAPMSRGFARDGVPADGCVDYYRRRAEGGIGLIISEGVSVCSNACHMDKGVPDFYGDEAIATWRRVASAARASGAAFMPQLWHTGLLRSIGLDRDAEESVGPSSKYPINGDTTGGPVMGRAMTEQDVEAAIDAFARAAEIAEQIGCDGVELHGAHGYLIDQFFWANTNRRKDGYGGDIAQRTRFAAEIVAEIRRRVDPSFVVGLRFSQWKLSDHYQARMFESPHDLERFLAPLIDAGVDFFDCSTRRYWESEFDGSDMNLAGWTKKVSGMPTMTIGSIGLDGPLMANRERRGEEAKPVANLSRLLEMYARGDFDLVGIGRALIANPHWVNLVADGRMDELTPYSSESLAALH